MTEVMAEKMGKGKDGGGGVTRANHEKEGSGSHWKDLNKSMT